jgi:ubiquinol-cytochrome c reductase cytochrome b subunit
MRAHNKIQLLSVLNTHLIAYPTPMNLNYSWNGGSLAGVMLASQMLTGILLAMHYVGHVDYAFASVQHLMTDVPSGMILRYAHANGASLFFIVVYLHVLRGMYYGSGAQPRELVWITGVVILLVMIITAFIGYVLPWGQMSFWGINSAPNHLDAYTSSGLLDRASLEITALAPAPLKSPGLAWALAACSASC